MRVVSKLPLVLHGETEVKKRKDLVRRFQEDEAERFFVLSLKAGGAGLNLTAASHVVHFDRWWNPAVENQATDRAFHIGQTRAFRRLFWPLPGNLAGMILLIRNFLLKGNNFNFMPPWCGTNPPHLQFRIYWLSDCLTT